MGCGFQNFISYRKYYGTMSTKNNQKNIETNNKLSRKQVDRIFTWQSEQLNCQKQIKALYQKLSKAFEKGISLQEHKKSLQENRMCLSTASNPKEQYLYKQLIRSRQQYKISQVEHASIKKELIENSSKIKETTKQIQTIKKVITQRQEIYQKMKQQTQKLTQRQIHTTKSLIDFQQNIKKQTLKKLALMKIPKERDNNLHLPQQILRKIDEMKKINQTLKQMLIL